MSSKVLYILPGASEINNMGCSDKAKYDLTAAALAELFTKVTVVPYNVQAVDEDDLFTESVFVHNKDDEVYLIVHSFGINVMNTFLNMLGEKKPVVVYIYEPYPVQWILARENTVDAHEFKTYNYAFFNRLKVSIPKRAKLFYAEKGYESSRDFVTENGGEMVKEQRHGALQFSAKFPDAAEQMMKHIMVHLLGK